MEPNLVRPAQPAAEGRPGGERCACGKPAVTLLRYSGQRLCKADFLTFVERRVKAEVREQGPFDGKTIAVAVSGGKDSVVMLRLLAENFGNHRRTRLVAITIDEGIAEYRPAGIEIAREHCRELGIPHKVVGYAETRGVTMDAISDMAGRRHPHCAYCGVLRRQSLNSAASEAGADYVATGHNLDDVSQSILMNFLKGDAEGLARLAPHGRGGPAGLVPRILPLRAIPEREVALYAMLRGWRFHDGDCPYSVEATRGKYRDLLLSLEEETPGTRHALVAGLRRLVRGREGGTSPTTCTRCGEPSTSALCRACSMLDELIGARTGHPE